MGAPLIPPATLARLRAVSERAMPDSCDISRLTTVDDTAGGGTASWVIVDIVPCRIRPAGQTPAEIALADQAQGVALFTVSCPDGADVRATDRIVVGGDTFEVVGIMQPNTYAVSTEVIVRRRR